MSDLDYLEQATTTATALDEVMAYVRSLETLQAKIENLESELSELKAQEKHLSSEVIPQFLAQAGLDELKLTNGKRVTIKEDVYARVPADVMKRQEAFAWLREHGIGDKIKMEAVIESPNQEIYDFLNETGVPYSKKEEINTNSLQAVFREMLGLKKGSVASIDVADVPSVFGLFLQKSTKIS